MTKFLRRFVEVVGVLVVLFVVLALSGHIRVVDARLTGTNPTGSSADTFCAGPKSKEVCFDASGDAIPTTNNTQTLGTSALSWSNTYSTTLTAGTGGLVNSSGPSQLAILTTTQLQARTDPAGTIFFSSTAFSGPSIGLCASTAPVIGSYVYLSSSTTTDIGKVCN